MESTVESGARRMEAEGSNGEIEEDEDELVVDQSQTSGWLNPSRCWYSTASVSTLLPPAQESFFSKGARQWGCRGSHPVTSEQWPVKEGDVRPSRGSKGSSQ